jgi:hypothetical protein
MAENESALPKEEPIGDPNSAKLLLPFAQEVALADEQERQRHLDNKAGTLAGFVAVALSLEAGFGATVFVDGSLDCAVEALFTTFYVVGVGGLAAAGLSALLGVLAPRGYLALTEEAIEGLASKAELNAPPDVIRERQLETVVQITLDGRKTNDRKVKSLKWASISLAIGVGAIGAQGLALAFA